MTRDDIIRMAREAGVKPLLYDGKWAVEGLDVFAALVAAAKRPPLTDEQIKVLWESHRAALPRYLCFARAIERKVRGE